MATGFSFWTGGRLGILAVVLTAAAYGCGRREASPPADAAPAAVSSPASTSASESASGAEPRPSGPAIVAAAEAAGKKPSELVPPKDPGPPPEAAPAALPAAGQAQQATSLERQLAGLQIPPAWLEGVHPAYDTSRPWKDARLEVRRLLSLNTDAARKEAVKLTWIYLKKGDIGDGHEYPMYLFLGGEPLWAIPVHEEFLARPHAETPIHVYVTLASLYSRFGAFEKAKAALDRAATGLPGPPWRIARQADLHVAYGDLYAAWGKSGPARQHYAEAVRLYPTSNQPFGQHLLKRQAARVQTKLDLLSAESLALGYAGDVDVALTVREGKIADVQVRHQEKIDQGASVIIPQRIVEKQSVLVDGITGATVTKDAIVDGALRCLRKAGLQ